MRDRSQRNAIVRLTQASMPFPISTSGSIPIPSEAANVSDEGIILACADQIEHERGRVVSRTKQMMLFEAPFFRSWTSGWWVTVLASAGQFAVATHPDGRRELRYRLSTLRTAVIGTLVVLFGFGFLFPRYAVAAPNVFSWPFILFAWLWIVGANWVAAAVRVRFWCRRRVADAKAAASVTPTGVPARQPNER